MITLENDPDDADTQPTNMANSDAPSDRRILKTQPAAHVRMRPTEDGTVGVEQYEGVIDAAVSQTTVARNHGDDEKYRDTRVYLTKADGRVYKTALNFGGNEDTTGEDDLKGDSMDSVSSESGDGSGADIFKLDSTFGESGDESGELIFDTAFGESGDGSGRATEIISFSNPMHWIGPLMMIPTIAPRTSIRVTARTNPAQHVDNVEGYTSTDVTTHTSTEDHVTPGTSREWTVLGDNELYKYIYLTSLTWLVAYIAPLGALAVLNVMLIRGLQKARNTHARLTGQSRLPQNKESLSQTLNIIVVVTVFLVCQAPDFIQIVLLQVPTVEDKTRIMNITSSLAFCFLAINCSANFGIYCVCYKKFRTIADGMLVCRKKKSEMKNGKVNGTDSRSMGDNTGTNSTICTTISTTKNSI